MLMFTQLLKINYGYLFQLRDLYSVSFIVFHSFTYFVFIYDALHFMMTNNNI